MRGFYKKSAKRRYCLILYPFYRKVQEGRCPGPPPARTGPFRRRARHRRRAHLPAACAWPCPRNKYKKAGRLPAPGFVLLYGAWQRIARPGGAGAKARIVHGRAPWRPEACPQGGRKSLHRAQHSPAAVKPCPLGEYGKPVWCAAGPAPAKQIQKAGRLPAPGFVLLCGAWQRLARPGGAGGLHRMLFMASTMRPAAFSVCLCTLVSE